MNLPRLARMALLCACASSRTLALELSYLNKGTDGVFAPTNTTHTFEASRDTVVGADTFWIANCRFPVGYNAFQVIAESP